MLRAGATALALLFASAPAATQRVPLTDTARVSAATPRTAADSALEATTRQLASELRCPVCQGLSIGDSPSELALEMRGVIREQLRAGRTPDEVRRYFVDKYGEWILLAPKAQGFNLLVYAVPVLAVLGGFWLVWARVRRWTSTASSDPTSARPES